MDSPVTQINKLAVTQDRKYIGVASHNLVKVYDISNSAMGGATASCEAQFEGNTGNITALEFQKDNKWFFTASEDGTLKIFDFKTTGYMRNFDNNGIRVSGGLGCGGCHRGEECDIDPGSRNNGVFRNISGTANDDRVFRSPSLRHVVRSNGVANGPYMYTGDINSLNDVLSHYNNINANGNRNLDRRLNPGGNAQQLNITAEERQALLAFMMTLAGNGVYTNEKWSSPFLD